MINFKRPLLSNVLIAIMVCFAMREICALAAECTGQQVKADCTCATSRACAVQGSLCNEKLTALEYSCCADGEPADNCHTVEGNVICAKRHECNRVGAACNDGNYIGDSTASKVSSEGDCQVPQG